MLDTFCGSKAFYKTIMIRFQKNQASLDEHKIDSNNLYFCLEWVEEWVSELCWLNSWNIIYKSILILILLFFYTGVF